MPSTLQSFLVNATKKAAEDLIAAISQLPEERQNWQPAGAARTALDQFAECALNNAYTAEIIWNRESAIPAPDAYLRAKEEAVGQGIEKLTTLLRENTELVVAAIQSVPDEDLEVEITLPWGPSPLSGILSYPYWNMAYHLGQINYIGSILEIK